MYKRQDTFYTRAKAAGYRSRAAFKLLELARRGRLLRRGDRVLDLGAWPGGWLQVAAELVGPTGLVVGIDLRPIVPIALEQVRVLVGDVSDATVQKQILQTCGGKVDVVLSDLAPKLSGVRSRDEAQAEALADSVLHLLEAVLKPGGTLLMKMFTGESMPQQLRRLRERFSNVRSTRPEATRRGSSEMYVIAVGFHGLG